MTGPRANNSITPRQKEYMEYITGYFAVYERMPPTAVLAKEFQVSNHAVYSMLNSLEAKHVLVQNAAGDFVPGKRFRI